MKRTLSYAQALHEATAQEMRRDDSVIVVGLGVTDTQGVFGTTRGLADRFGDRVLETPLSEEGMTGVAIGAALAGLRPIHVHTRMDFLLLAMNQLVNMAAKIHYMYGGAVRVPLVVRSVIGRSWGQGPQHSQGLHAMFMHVPGLKVCAPSTAYDAKGCLIQSIRDNNPVIFVEHRMLYRTCGIVPTEPYTVPLGGARTLAPGDDVTIVGVSFMALEALRAHRLLGPAGIRAEVIDPVTLAPLDAARITASVRRTGRLLVVDTGWPTCGAGAEIIATVAEQLAGLPDLRVARLGFAPTPCPTTQNLQDRFYPGPHEIASAAFALVRGEDRAGPGFARLATPEHIEFKGPF